MFTVVVVEGGGDELSTVVWAWSVFDKSVDVFLGSITCVGMPMVVRMMMMELMHELVPVDFGNDRGEHDFKDLGISLDDSC